MVFCILLSYPLSILPSVSLSSSLVLLLNRSSCGHTKNLARDYWSSMYFMKLQEDIRMRAVDPEMEHASGWNFSPRLSSVHCSDDPFQNEHTELR